MFHFFSTTIPNKRQRFITCSLDPASTSSIIDSQNSTYKNRAREKSLEMKPTNDGTFSVVHSDGHKPYDKKINRDETKNGANKGLKSGPEKRRPLWQKAVFASNKMRSILLLNAITIVYGMYDFLRGNIVVYFGEILGQKSPFFNWRREIDKRLGNYIICALMRVECLLSDLSHSFPL